MNLLRKQISEMIQSVIDGETSACEVYAMLKDAEAQIKSGLIVIKDPAMEEARTFTKGEVYFGGVWEFRNSATYLDFSEDDTYQALNSKALARKKDLNTAWKMSQDSKGFFDSDTGEQIPVLSVKTPAKEGLIFKAK